MNTDEAATLVAVVADLHTNSVRGLCPPSINLDAGGTYKASKAQRLVWQRWCDYRNIIDAKKKTLNCKLYVVVAGDVGDKNTHDGSGLISRVDSDEVKIAAKVLEGLREIADEFFVVRGTPAHEGPQACLSELIARDLDATPDEESGTHSWWWLPLEVGGVRFDIAHHPQTSGRRPWTKAAAAARNGAILRAEYLDDGERPPDVAIRGHVHYWQPGPREPKPQFFSCPPWQLTTAFGHRLGAGGHIEPVGGMWFVCRGGRYTWDVERSQIKRRKAWTASS
jgi:hypothetical protein